VNGYGCPAAAPMMDHRYVASFASVDDEAATLQGSDHLAARDRGQLR
jgi:hypothetical protein